MKLCTRVATLFAAALVVMLGFSGNASAQPNPYPPGPCAQVSVSSTIVPAGGHLGISGSGFTAGAHLTIELHTSVIVLGHVTVDANGDFSTTVTIPADVSGHHTITVTGDAIVKVCPIDPIQVTVSGTGGGKKHRPSSTGVAIASMLALAGLLVVAGFALNAGGKKRKRRSHRPTPDAFV